MLIYVSLSYAGEGAIDPNDPNKENTLSQLVKTEISLSLTRKYDLREGEEQDIKGLMIKYVAFMNFRYNICTEYLLRVKLDNISLLETNRN